MLVLGKLYTYHEASCLFNIFVFSNSVCVVSFSIVSRELKFDPKSHDRVMIWNDFLDYKRREVECVFI